jgi:hypothetical protein
MQKQIVFSGADDLVKVLEYEEQLCQIIERLEPVPERSMVAVLCQHPIG